MNLFPKRRLQWDSAHLSFDPLASKRTPQSPVDFDFVHSALIGPALKNAGLVGSTTGEIIDAGNIREDMFALIVEAD